MTVNYDIRCYEALIIEWITQSALLLASEPARGHALCFVQKSGSDQFIPKNKMKNEGIKKLKNNTTKNKMILINYK